MVRCFICHLIYVFLDLICFIAKNVLSHIYVLPNVERILVLNQETYIC